MDFQSAMETFAEAWMAAQVSGKIVLGNNNNNNISSSSTSGHVPAGSNYSGTGRDTPIESPLQQQLGSNVDYGKMPSCMDLSSSSCCTTGTTTTTTTATTTTLSPVKRLLKGVGGSRNQNNSSPSSSSATCANIPPTLGKSMPIHCIIEVSNGSNNNRKVGDSIPGGETGTSSSNNNNSTTTSTTLDIINQNNKEVDDFVIIPAGTPFQDVVTTVLTLLGYPKDIIRQAEGTICLRNWKPLRLDQVCDSSAKTVGDILNDLTNHATLRVLVTRAKGGTTEDLKEKLLRLLLAHSSSLLMGAGCPLDEMTMSQLVKGQWPQNLAEDVKRRFNQWYKSLHPGTTLGLLESLQHTHLQQQQHQQVTNNNSSTHSGNLIGSNHVGVSSIHHHLVNGTGHHHHHHHGNDLTTKATPFIDDDQNHPVFHGLTTQKTRMRTSFDPEMELPKLQQWFAENPHPSRHQIQQYVRELNSLDCRKDRKPLDVNNVIYWFKNARAAQKRNEIRYNGLSPGHTQSYAHHHHHHHGHTLNAGSHHHHLLHSSSHSHGEGRGSGGGVRERDMTNGDSGNDHSGGSSCRDSTEDYQDAEVSKENVEDRGLLVDMKENDRILRNIKEERDEDYINVDVDNNGGTNEDGDGDGEGEEPSPRGSPRVKNETTTTTTPTNNNNEEPKDLSSSGKSPLVDSGEDTFDEKPERERRRHLSSPPDKDHQHHHRSGGSDGGKGSRVGEKSQVISDDNGVDMIRHESTDLVGENSNNSTCSSVSPRSSPGGLSPTHQNYDFNGPPSMLSRFHPFFDHPSIMAYRHFNSFNFGSNFPGGGGGGNGSDSAAAYEAALNVTRKSLLPLGKPPLSSSSSAALDIFHEFPQGLNPSSMVVAAANGRNGGGVISGSGVNCDPLSRLRAEELFPPRPASSADIISSIINSNRTDFSPLNLGNHHHHHHHSSPNSNSTLDERRKRNRTFIDPVTEVVLLENWFKIQTHPSHSLILKYTEQLNNMPYRQKFPKLEPKNIQFWFKNRRAKCKRLKMTL